MKLRTRLLLLVASIALGLGSAVIAVADYPLPPCDPKCTIK